MTPMIMLKLLHILLDFVHVQAAICLVLLVPWLALFMDPLAILRLLPLLVHQSPRILVKLQQLLNFILKLITVGIKQIFKIVIWKDFVACVYCVQKCLLHTQSIRIILNVFHIAFQLNYVLFDYCFKLPELGHGDVRCEFLDVRYLELADAE